MVLGEPRPILPRTLSMVGRSPARSSESAAWLTSLWVMPRGGGPSGLGCEIGSSMCRIIQHMYRMRYIHIHY